jgi:hypothetical protein
LLAELLVEYVVLDILVVVGWLEVVGLKFYKFILLKLLIVQFLGLTE